MQLKKNKQNKGMTMMPQEDININNKTYFLSLTFMLYTPILKPHFFLV